MRTLPPQMVQVLASFAPLFSRRVWQHAQVLLVGAILAPGKRTVASALRTMGFALPWCSGPFRALRRQAGKTAQEQNRMGLAVALSW